jgi:CubicO group peptidase (beta-lactamase class C family)
LLYITPAQLTLALQTVEKSTMKKIFTTAAVICLFVITGQAQQFRKAADSVRKSRVVPSISYAVMNADGIIEMAAVGYKKLRTKDTVNVNNRYHLGGNTINFTAYIAAQLVKQGKIKWVTKLVDVFTDLKKTARPEFQNVTLVDLLSQRGGIPKFNTHFEFIAPGFAGNELERHIGFTRWVTARRGLMDSATGKRPMVFSNASAIPAIAMLEKVSGKGYEKLLNEYVNKPFGISVKFGFPNRINKDEPWGHNNETGSFEPLSPNHWWGMPPAFTAACDANSTVGDYAKFILDNLRGLTGKPAKLPANIYQLLHYSYAGYAIGWGNVNINGQHISDHDGTLETFFVHTEIHKEQNLAIIVMCNSGGTPGKAACINLARIIREKYIHYK